MSKHLYKEKHHHGTIEFPIAFYHTHSLSYFDKLLYYHWHHEFEFLLLTEGNASFQLDEKTVDLYAGDAIFINSGSLHSASALSFESGCTFYAVVFDRTFLASFNEHINTSYIQPIIDKQLIFTTTYSLNIPWQSDILTRLHELFSLNETKPTGYELLLKVKLFEIWYLCFLHAQTNAQKARSSQQELIKQVLSYVHTYHDEKITLKELADLVCMSEGQFCRFFKQYTHQSPFTYLKSYRIKYSCELLRQSNKKIAEIAMLSGFDNVSYFNKTFRSFMDCTPLEYRHRYMNSR